MTRSQLAIILNWAHPPVLSYPLFERDAPKTLLIHRRVGSCFFPFKLRSRLTLLITILN